MATKGEKPSNRLLNRRYPGISAVGVDADPEVINLFKDRRTSQHLKRIGRVLRVQRLHGTGKNVVAHCRA
jgi:hypothetical protein